MTLMYAWTPHMVMHDVFEEEKIGQLKMFSQRVILIWNSHTFWLGGKEQPQIQEY